MRGVHAGYGIEIYPCGIKKYSSPAMARQYVTVVYPAKPEILQLLCLFFLYIHARVIETKRSVRMCNPIVLERITRQITREARTVFGEGFEKALLYGSYARGDHDETSDVDIMILADIPPEASWAMNQKMNNLANRLGLENDVLISLCVKDSKTFYKWLDVLPFYRNIMKDGVELNA